MKQLSQVVQWFIVLGALASLAFAQPSKPGVAATGVYGVGIQIGMAEMGAYLNFDPATLAKGLGYAHGLASASGCIPVDEIDSIRDAMLATRESRSLFPRITEYRQRLADYIMTHCDCGAGGIQTPPVQSLPWIGGAWLDGGQPASIDQDSNNRTRLMFRNRYGSTTNGHFSNATTVVADSWGSVPNMLGTLENSGNTLRWANGSVWYRAPPPLDSRTLPWIGGAWLDGGQPASIDQDPNDRTRLMFRNRYGSTTNGHFSNATTVVADSWGSVPNMLGTLENSGNTLRWANGSVWYRAH